MTSITSKKTFKDLKVSYLNLGVLVGFTSCYASYTGKTFRYMKVSVSEHPGVSSWTRKYVKTTLSTSAMNDMPKYDHKVTFGDFKIPAKGSNHRLLKVKQKFFIKRYKSSIRPL